MNVSFNDRSHIRFLSDNKTVCAKPKRLGYDFVVLDTATMEKPPCVVCSQLLFAHNSRTVDEKYQIWTDLLQGPHRLERAKEDPLARGIFYGMLFSVGFWAFVIAIGWLVFFVG